MEQELDYQVPPPAYSEEEEFDQKTSIATELSTHTVLDSGGWEVYDPYNFENHSDVHVGKSEWAVHVNLHSTPLRIEKILQSKAVDNIQCIPPNKYSMKERHIQHTNYLASSSQWHEADAHPGKSTLERSDTNTLASFRCSQDILPDGIYNATSFNATSFEDPVSAQVWQPERLTPLGYSFDAQPATAIHGTQVSYRTSYESTLIDAQSKYDDPVQSRRLRSLPPTPTPPRQQLPFQEHPMNAYHFIQPPVIKFDASIAYGNTPSSPSLPRRQLVSPRPDAQHDSYSFYNSAVSAQLNILKSSQHDRTPVQRQYQARTTLQADLSPNRRSHFNQRPDSMYTI